MEYAQNNPFWLMDGEGRKSMRNGAAILLSDRYPRIESPGDSEHHAYYDVVSSENILSG